MNEWAVDGKKGSVGTYVVCGKQNWQLAFSYRFDSLLLKNNLTLLVDKILNMFIRSEQPYLLSRFYEIN